MFSLVKSDKWIQRCYKWDFITSAAGEAHLIVVSTILIPRNGNYQSDWEEQYCGWMHSPDSLLICHKWTVNGFAYSTTTCVLEETNREKKKRSRLLQVINHCDDITEAFLMSCSHRCQAWVEPSRGNHLTCGRKISGSLKTCISHCKQYFTTIRTLKYLRLSHRPEPLPLCCRALIYHFHYFQVYSQPVFSFFLIPGVKLMSCVEGRGGVGWCLPVKTQNQTRTGRGHVHRLMVRRALLLPCKVEKHATALCSWCTCKLGERRSCSTKWQTEPGGNCCNVRYSCKKKLSQSNKKTYFIFPSRGAKPGPLTPHAGPGANIGVCIEIFTDSGVRPRTEVMIQVSGDDDSAWEQLRDDQVDKNTQSQTRYVALRQTKRQNDN